MPATVVVVHNEPGLRELALGTLREAGIEAVGFNDPMAALDAIEADPRVRVLVTRMNFGAGTLNGVALARMLRIKRPCVRTVFVAQRENEEHADGVGEFLALPMDPLHLADVVARLLMLRMEAAGADL